jgi:hypothetical protein
VPKLIGWYPVNDDDPDGDLFRGVWLVVGVVLGAFPLMGLIGVYS